MSGRIAFAMVESCNVRRISNSQLHRVLCRQLCTLGRLRDRLVAHGYTPDDEYFSLVLKAYNASHALTVATHYATCEHGVCAR